MKERIRIIAALDPDGAAPTVVGALSETIWEVIPDEDWERIRHKMIDASGVASPDVAGFIDLIITVDYDEFKRLGQMPELAGTVAKDSP